MTNEPQPNQSSPEPSPTSRETRRLTAPRLPRAAEPKASRTPSPSEIDELINALGDPNHPRHTVAVDELVAIGPAAVPALCAVVGPHQPWLTVYRATEVLAQIGDGRATGPLIAALNHQNANVRWGAVRALAQVGDVRALFALRKVVQTDQGRTSWGESVAGVAQSALDLLNRRSIWSQSLELIKLAIVSVIFLLSMALAFGVIGTLRNELDQFGRYVPGQTELPTLVLPTTRPTATPRPTLAANQTVGPQPTTQVITGTALQVANVRPLPGTNNQPIGRINAGDEIIFIARTANGQWYLIRLGNQRSPDSFIANPDGSGTGWVNQALVSPPSADVPVQEPLPVTVPTATP
ncbi:HEAT repeat domain-containing protein [Chloroflexus aggregans]|uniref:SH3 type 3 domain protein n=1 Tax=Chloroflexus aggregans (strain MD-66 / DSM 9485) TaxID=326427 RepID=B8GCR0_CHLAD|nr:HEAT repeat domain-containing protein [Chloroflexus aggregans]ACL23110.1 SH3 type 3 domain protein [Chloroflexus aggregans DSM 9485]